MSLTLPTELILHTLEDNGLDSKDVAACCLASRAFDGLARPLLYQHLKLEVNQNHGGDDIWRPSSRRLVTSLRANASLSVHVRRVTIVPSSALAPDSVPALDNLVSAFSSLTRIRFEALRSIDCDWIVSCVGACRQPGLHEVAFAAEGYDGFTINAKLLRCLAQVQGLDSLSLERNVSVDDTDVEPDPPLRLTHLRSSMSADGFVALTASSHDTLASVVLESDEGLGVNFSPFTALRACTYDRLWDDDELPRLSQELTTFRCLERLCIDVCPRRPLAQDGLSSLELFRAFPATLTSAKVIWRALVDRDVHVKRLPKRAIKALETCARDKTWCPQLRSLSFVLKKEDDAEAAVLRGICAARGIKLVTGGNDPW